MFTALAGSKSFFFISAMHGDLRVWTKIVPRSMKSLHFPHIKNLGALRISTRQYSKVRGAFELPEIHFGVEQSPSANSSCFTLRTSLYLPVPLNRVWENFHVPQTLNAITPPHLNFMIMSPQPVQMGEGAVIDYRQGAPPTFLALIPEKICHVPIKTFHTNVRRFSLRLHGVPFKWRTRCVQPRCHRERAPMFPQDNAMGPPQWISR